MIQNDKASVGTVQLVQFSLRKGRGILLHGIVMLLFLLTQSHIGHAETLKGQVLDAESSKPIAGAVVLGVWTKKSGLPGLHHTELVGVKEAETNEEGWFELEKPPGRFHEDGEKLTVYKFGYVAWNNLFMFPSSVRRHEARVPSRILLERFPSGQSHQRHLSFINNSTAAGMYGVNSIPKFWSALRSESQMR
jgi:hypothetical protein